MKKSAIAIAVAAALGTSAVALAETTLYGSARVSVDFTNPDLSDTYKNGITVNGKDYQIRYNGNSVNTEKFTEVWNDASRLGVRGSEDLGSGISAIYQYEFGVDVPGSKQGDKDIGTTGTNYWDSNRPRWVGLKGDFGALTLGTQFTPYYNVIGYTDTFNSNKTFDRDYYLRGSNTLSTPVFFQKGIAQLRRGSSVVYTTPNWNGLSAQGMVTMDGTPGANNVDQWEANLTYANGPWFVGGAFLQDRDQQYGTPNANGTTPKQHDNQYGVAAGWDNKQFGIGGSWQQYKPDETVNTLNLTVTPGTASTPGTVNITGIEYAKVNAYTLQGQVYFGSEVFRLTGSYVKPDNIDTKAYVFEAGLQHNLSKRTRLWLEGVYTKQSFDDAKKTVGGTTYEINPDDANMYLVSAGIRHDF